MSNTYTLSSGFLIPKIGFGTWQLNDQDCYDAVLTALKIGYRHIDTAQIYGNHAQVGQAIKDSGISRNELFVTTKLWRKDMHKDQVKVSLQKSLKELGLDYVDMFLIHWPQNRLQNTDTLPIFKTLVSEQLTRSTGVCNFTIKHLQDSIEFKDQIVTNQVEFHPSLYQRDLLEYCSENNIILTAYSPLGRGYDLKIEVITDIAQSLNCTPAQVILAWLFAKNIVAIPKSTSKERIKENFDSLNIVLTHSQISRIDSLNEDNRTVNPSFAEYNYS